MTQEQLRDKYNPIPTKQKGKESKRIQELEELREEEEENRGLTQEQLRDKYRDQEVRQREKTKKVIVEKSPIEEEKTSDFIQRKKETKRIEDEPFLNDEEEVIEREKKVYTPRRPREKEKVSTEELFEGEVEHEKIVSRPRKGMTRKIQLTPEKDLEKELNEDIFERSNQGPKLLIEDEEEKEEYTTPISRIKEGQGAKKEYLDEELDNLITKLGTNQELTSDEDRLATELRNEASQILDTNPSDEENKYLGDIISSVDNQNIFPEPVTQKQRSVLRNLKDRLRRIVGDDSDSIRRISSAVDEDIRVLPPKTEEERNFFERIRRDIRNKRLPEPRTIEERDVLNRIRGRIAEDIRVDPFKRREDTKLFDRLRNLRGKEEEGKKLFDWKRTGDMFGKKGLDEEAKKELPPMIRKPGFMKPEEYKDIAKEEPAVVRDLGKKQEDKKQEDFSSGAILSGILENIKQTKDQESQDAMKQQVMTSEMEKRIKTSLSNIFQEVGQPGGIISECIPSTKDKFTDAKSFVAEQKFLTIFTDDQLNRIGLDRNIPDVVIYPRERKIQMILSDPYRLMYDLTGKLEDMTLGDLLYLAAKENIMVNLIPDRFNVRRILVSLILFQRKRSDLIQYDLLTDDDLRTIVYVIENNGDIHYSWILKRCDLEKILDTGSFPKLNDEFLSRWKRYEVLKILPQTFLQSDSFQIPSSDLAMTPTDNYMIARLIDLSSNPFENIYARDRNMDPDILKAKYGIVVPRTWNVLDYLGLNGRFFPMKNPNEQFSAEKLITIGTREGQRDYLNQYDDMAIFAEIKNYIPYSSRPELIENVLTLFDSTENIYFVSLLPQLQGKIYYGNYKQSTVYTPESLSSKLEFLTTQNYPLEDKLVILRKVRQLQNLLQSRNMITPLLASSISRLVTTYESNPDAQPYYYYFMLLPQSEVANVRKIFYQRFYFAQTRNCLYTSVLKSDFVNNLPGLFNVNIYHPNIQQKCVHDCGDDLYQTIAYMKLFFGYVPHSIRNL